MNAESEQLIDAIEYVLPGFRADCESEDNLFRGDDGNLTVHGVWSFCTGWVRPRLPHLQPRQVEALAVLLNDQADGQEVELSNAVATCFLENLAGDPHTELLRSRLTGMAADHWDRWAGRSRSR